MSIKQLNEKPEIRSTSKLEFAYNQFRELLGLLGEREIPGNLIDQIIEHIEALNQNPDSGKHFKRHLKRSQTKILKILEKEVKIVPRNYYQTTWMVLGMTVFGVPMGVAFGASLGNMAFLGIGLPIGMAIGIAVGSGMDKKAEEEGRQLDITIKY